ncbi:MAG: response regulator [Gemmatimonadota bacterium]
MTNLPIDSVIPIETSSTVQPTAVLVVDDDPVTLILLPTLLTAAGYEVRTATNGREAWDILRVTPIPVVISDWSMPVLDGVQLCRQIRARTEAPYTYFILVTTRSGKDSYLTGMEAGADDFITKPVDRDELLARIKVAERILGLHQELKRLEGLLPICAYCKRIRDDGGKWNSLETYIGQRSKAQFTHGICDDCVAKLLGADTALPGQSR